MRKRNARILALIEIIKNNTVGSQDDLLRLLAQQGFIITQATLSRDLKMLKTSKVTLDHGEYAYMLPDAITAKSKPTSEFDRHPINGFISIEFTGNLGVMLTKNGYASGIAYDIDMLDAPEIAGTIAGANTIFIAFREGVSREQAKEVLGHLVPINESQQTENLQPTDR